MDNREVYLDNAATTPINHNVLEVMLPFLKENYGNPSSLHKFGRISKSAIENSRNKISQIINCEPSEIIFTSGGTEANNLAILGIARANKNKGKHIIVSSIEHKSILDACKVLEKEEFEIDYLDVDKNGLVKLEDLKNKIRKDTILVSIMYANNEVGSIQPIKEISRFLKGLSMKSKTNNEQRLTNNFPLFHCDACQAVNYLPVDIKKIGVDSLTISASKIYGPKGTGILYVNKKIKIAPLIVGGGQERGLRSGTPNVAFIVGTASALKISEMKREKESERLTKLRDYFLLQIKKKIKGIIVNGGMKNRLPNNLNISVKGVEGETLLLILDDKNIYCSTGSACSSMDLNPSYVLVNMGLPLGFIHCSIRFGLGRHTNKADIDYTVKVLSESINKIRAMSPAPLNDFKVES